MNIIRWIDYARKNIRICKQIKEITDQPIRGEMARIKAIKDIRAIMREVYNNDETRQSKEFD